MFYFNILPSMIFRFKLFISKLYAYTFSVVNLLLNSLFFRALPPYFSFLILDHLH
ncbi:hypothetical protein NBO_514g0003 [Nosema bombycis CQ1]|uniref:Uncharacterized protein n=1 Tax=Nosema bombycis (strain CQ1 / CVCC 102059) TaxID=578461 RepID=R0MH67_NOSB1|nr:hypothetical protein NBO_514g0003 [Nosema bombycis CQ1]|eukprot:EOB12138.1 hypothetical protein NBO_514g0003 [Nosema bombycis CQ1]